MRLPSKHEHQQFAVPTANGDDETSIHRAADLQVPSGMQRPMTRRHRCRTDWRNRSSRRSILFASRHATCAVTPPGRVGTRQPARDYHCRDRHSEMIPAKATRTCRSSSLWMPAASLLNRSPHRSTASLPHRVRRGRGGSRGPPRLPSADGPLAEDTLAELRRNCASHRSSPQLFFGGRGGSAELTIE